MVSTARPHSRRSFVTLSFRFSPRATHRARIDGGASHNVIGGAGGRNLISGNSSDGVNLSGLGTDFNAITGNYIGTDASGNAAKANTEHGVYLFNGPMYNDIGGELAAD